jgi:cullin-associated NEDD8-dissociated protein 1
LLKFGAPPPESYADDNVTYSLFESSAHVEAYVSSDQSEIGAVSTIFKVEDEFGNPIYLKNMASDITLGGLYTMRNPPNFMDLTAPELRDAEYEIDAFLMNLIQQPSAPPFIAKNLLQLHGFSNPSPRQVERVATAFMRGTYSKGNSTFGDGRYGSLAAVSAAIALDPESLAPVLDEDPIHGNIREPLLKVIAVMRSLNFQRHPSVKLRHGLFHNMRYKIGQMVRLLF